MYSIAVLGAGISGLSAAHRLEAAGFTCTVFEKSSHVGGVIASENSGGFLVEYGPGSIQSTTPLLADIMNELGLGDDAVEALPAVWNRYIVRRRQLVQVPLSPGALLKSDLFSTSAKLRLLAEPFIPRNRKTAVTESVASFFTRRFGKEVVDYGINPFVAGTFAGDPERLVMKFAFPSISRLEVEHGSVFRGMLSSRKLQQASAENDVPNGGRDNRRNVFSFRDGMQTLPLRISENLRSPVVSGATVQSVSPGSSGWNISYRTAAQTRNEMYDGVIATLPLHAWATVGKGIEELEGIDSLVPHPPLAIVHTGFARVDIGHPLDGFGVLVPERENLGILGTLFPSSFLPHRAPEDHVLLTSFVGGSRDPESAKLPDDELLDLVLTDLKMLLGLAGRPVFQRIVRRPASIPQYEGGYRRVLNALNAVEHKFPTIRFAGSYRGGISVSDALQSGHDAAGTLAGVLEKI